MLLQRIESTIRKHELFQKGEKVLVAISGGVDSMALLHLLNEIPFSLKLHAVYVDHGLRPIETSHEQLHIAALCAQKNIPFETVSVDTHRLQRKTKGSLEEAARILRYQALDLQRVKIQAQTIAVAHTADDQAEELLIRLIRGTGRKGLSGMKMRNGNIVRPLLQETKESLLSYLQKNHITHCEDSSNSQRIFLRNRVRLDLLPLLEKEFNASIRQNILQTQDILSHEEELLESLTLKKYNFVVSHKITSTGPPEHVTNTAEIDITSFSKCHRALQRRILEKVCWSMNTKPGFRQIQQLSHLIHEGREGAEAHLSRGLRIQRRGTTAIFSHPEGIGNFRGSATYVPPQILQEIPEAGVYSIAGTGMTLKVILEKITSKTTQNSSEGKLLLDADKLHFPLLLRSVNPGEKFSPLGMSSRKKITRFLSDEKIATEMRHLHPVLLTLGKIIAVVGLRIDNNYRITEKTTRILIVEWRKTEQMD